MTNLTDLLRETLVERPPWRRILGLAALGLVLILGYRAYEARHRAGRLEDLQLFQGVVESSLSDAWQRTGRSCASVKRRPECDAAPPRLEIAPDLDRQRPALERLRICRDWGEKPECQDVEFAGRARELDLARSYRDLLVLDEGGNVLASWRSAPGGLARLETSAVVSQTSAKATLDAVAKSAGPATAGVSDLAELLELKDSLHAAPSLRPVTLGGEDLELAWTPLNLPCKSRPCPKGVPSYLLAGITHRPPPGFERNEALVWHWVVLGALLLLPILAVVQIFYGSRSLPHLQERALLVAVLCGTLSLIALGIAVLALVERRPILDQERARAKDLRHSIWASVSCALERGTSAAERIRSEVAAGSLTGSAKPNAVCGFSPALDAELAELGAIAFLTNASGDQLCLENSNTSALVNRGDRNYFQALQKPRAAGERLRPVEIVNQQTGERNWVFGVAVARRPVAGEAPAEVREFLVNAGDRTAAFAFLALPVRLCPGVEGAACWVIDANGRMIFSNPGAYALSGLNAFQLVSPGFSLEARLTRPTKFTESLRLRNEAALVSVRELGVPGADEYAVALVPLAPRFRSLQHGLASIARSALVVWALPLLSLVVLCRMAPSRLIDALLPQRSPRSRYLLGAITLLAFGAFALFYSLRFLDPVREIRIAWASAFGSPLLAFALLGAETRPSGAQPKRLQSPAWYFRWYVPAFILVLATALSAEARDLGAKGIVLALPFVAAASSLLPALPEILKRQGTDTEAQRVANRRRRFRDWTLLAGRRPRIGYTAAVGAVLVFLVCLPVVLVGGAVLDTLHFADDQVAALADAKRDGGPASGEIRLSKGTSRILVGQFDAAGERRVAALQRLEFKQGRVWAERRVLEPSLVAVLIVLLGTTGWWLLCRKTFGWGAEAEGPISLGADRTAPRVSDLETEVLRAVGAGWLPTWTKGRATRRLLRQGLLDNRDGLVLTEAGRGVILPPLSAPVVGQATTGPTPTAPAVKPAPGLGLGWTYVLALAPVAIWLVGQPYLAGNVALWTTSIVSATKMVKRDG